LSAAGDLPMKIWALWAQCRHGHAASTWWWRPWWMEERILVSGVVVIVACLVQCGSRTLRP
jgi:hypothetical protein